MKSETRLQSHFSLHTSKCRKILLQQYFSKTNERQDVIYWSDTYLKLNSSFANFQHKLFTACNSVIRLINMISLQLNYCPLVNPLLGAWASVSLWWKYGINGFPHLRNIRRFSTVNRPKFICCQYLQHFLIKRDILKIRWSWIIKELCTWD